MADSPNIFMIAPFKQPQAKIVARLPGIGKCLIDHEVSTLGRAFALAALDAPDLGDDRPVARPRLAIAHGASA